MGMGRAFRIDLEEVFVRADVRYHTTHRALTGVLASGLGRLYRGFVSIGPESTYCESVGDRRPECLGQFLGVGTHAAIASSNRRDGFTDAFPWTVFGVPQCSIRMLARVEAGFPGLPQFIGVIFHRRAPIRTGWPRRLRRVLIRWELIYRAAGRLRVRGLGWDLQFCLAHGGASTVTGHCSCRHIPETSGSPC